VKEQAEAVEETLGVKRKLRILADDTIRNTPKVLDHINLDKDCRALHFFIPEAELLLVLGLHDTTDSVEMIILTGFAASSGHVSKACAACLTLMLFTAVAETVCGVLKNSCWEGGIFCSVVFPCQLRLALQIAQPAVHTLVDCTAVCTASHQLPE
jgi:hypothetical protein